MEASQPRTDYEITYCEIELEAPSWLSLKRRVERTAGLDSSLNATYELHNKRMNHLLEDMFIKMGELGITGGSVT